MDRALYFYCIRVQDIDHYRIIDGTVEVNPRLTTSKQFNEAREKLFQELSIDKSKAVFTSFSRL